MEEVAQMDGRAESRIAEMADSTDERWNAVQSRDARYDGTFVYAVRSTGIYCRPSCPARRPRREGVAFFSTPDQARQAGFRPCLRCQPDEPASAQQEMIGRAQRWIEEHVEGPVTLADLGNAMGVSPYHLQRTFKRLTGATPRQYGEACRLARLKARLREGDSVTEALYEAGYGSSSRLYEQAPAHLGMTPNQYRKGGASLRVRYTIIDCPLGRLLVAATEKGVCAAGIASADEELEAFLRSELPAANLTRDDAAVGGWAQEIVAQMAGLGCSPGVPLDLHGSDFQLRAWEALRAIPRGSTAAYGEVAAAIGQPEAIRAVARACAANPVAVLVPCHRVIRKDGGMGGYRWGMERKRALLATERSRTETEATPHPLAPL